MESREGRFLQKLNDKLQLVQSFLDREKVGEVTYDDFLVRQEILREIWEDFKKHEDAVRANKTIDDYRIETETRYMDLMGKIRYKLRASKPDDTDNTGIDFNAFLKQQSIFLNDFSAVNRHRQNEVKLPALNIPHFNGNYHDWPTFENLFLQIHNDERINKIRKFQYLKGLMVPNSTPDELIKHFSITEANYNEAWQLLKERFSKRRHIVTAFVKKFVDQPSTSQPSVTALRHICDTTENVVRGLRAIGPEAESRDPFLIYMLLDKIDDETKHLWARESNNNDNPTINDFIKFLSSRCDALETVQSSGRKSSSSKSNSQSTSKGSSQQRMNNFVSNTAATSPCLKCNQQHMLYECNDFKSMSAIDRQKFISERSLCFNCLKPGHRSNVCRSRHSCHKCSKRHHTLVHLAPTVGNTNASGNAFRAHAATITSNASNLQSVEDIPPNAQSTNFTNQPNSHISSLICSQTNRADDHEFFNNNFKSTSNASTSPVNMPQEVAPLHVTDSSQFTSLVSSRDVDFNCNSLLPTVSVYVLDSSRYLQCCRGLLDTGSHASFITESCAQRLSLQRFHAKKHVSGLASSSISCSRGYVKLEIYSKSHQQIMTVQALVLHTITSTLPPQSIDVSTWEYIKGLPLADPEFNIPNPIEILIGIEHSLELFNGNICRGPENYPSARESPFGWILSGKLPNYSSPLTAVHSKLEVHVEDTIDKVFRQFWELENIPSANVRTEDERYCEDIYKSGVKRLKSGRFSVRLPFKPQILPIGNSLNKAIARLNSMERLFKRKPSTKAEYTKFLNEYETLGHMTRIQPDEIAKPDNMCFYLPHHAVLKEDSSTTKLRVVFDGSSKTNTGFSINDNLLVGEQLQPNLFSILLKFRLHKFALVADIEKMFRQIEVHEDTDFQRIVWRDHENEEYRHYRLRTVTYGLACSPFLATRTLRELSNIIRANNPIISKIIDEQFYVDDLMMGCDNVQDAIKLRAEISDLLLSAGFPLRKWKSNNAEILSSIPENITELAPLDLQEPKPIFKVLGMQWNPHSDCFIFQVKPVINQSPTKRTILSEVASIYDPLGFLAPSIVLIKILLQTLWLRNLSWDEHVPDDVERSWLSLRSQFESFALLEIPRYILQPSTRYELHGFADASEKAYAASIYVRSCSEDGTIVVHLVAAKTKVAPLKTVSIPRLELCAALLLVRLLIVVKDALNMENTKTYCWSDSTTVLSWLSAHPNRWKTFVANRTAEILESTDRNCWHHVSSAENAADCASRGLLPNDLNSFKLWWHGPEFLRLRSFKLNISQTHDDQCDDMAKCEEKCKSTTGLVISTDNDNVLSLLVQCSSSWWEINRIMAFILRFIRNSRSTHVKTRQIRSHNSIVPPLNTIELQNAHTKIIKLVQEQSFEKDLQQISRDGCVLKRSSLISLSPFIHTDGLLRVGGRLQNSNIPFHVKHPIIMPKEHPVSLLLINYYHNKYFHAGTSMLISLLRQRYWIINSRNLVKKLVHQCLKCFRNRGQTMTQIMGALPHARTLTDVSPFTQTGIDYAGPIMIKEDKSRKAKHYKGYIALFVCFSTRALHLEVVKDLSTERFLEALIRFTSRRGYPAVIHTDNGTNFVGADRELKRLFSFMKSDNHNEAIINELAKNEIQWKFIPPSSPHFGGLWEAGVKSVKQHLMKAMNTTLTYDELSTMLCQIEALLNSRPLCPISDDPTDLNYLTPAHFLIGKPLTSFPIPDLEHITENRLSRWQSLQKRVQGFWKLWRMDYLSSLQQRPKWRSAEQNIEKGALVLLKQDNLPPGFWKLARVIECFPGADNKVRVVDIQTKDGVLRRPIHKLCLLPISK